MHATRFPLPYTCSRCLLRASSRRNAIPIRPNDVQRAFSQLSPLRSKDKKLEQDEPEKEPGAMSRRLAEATEEAVLEGGRAGRKAVEDAGFSEELKARLLEKVEMHKFRSENASAFAKAGLSSSKVGRGSADIAAAQGWSGEEAAEDTMLRMLDDARKPLRPGLRGSARIPTPVMVDMRPMRESKLNPGQRLANARDKTSVYASSRDLQMSDKERADMRREFKERFAPGARAMPNSIRGLAALANERIEDAIARGQFKNIPRGKAIERDTRADNPFLDTTEYIMNKMIQRQEIVPPWIEKQQELVKAAHVFRARLRSDWKRHAARTISSRGGSLQEQMQTADLYAEAERIYNPKRRAVESISVPTNATSDPVMVKITQETPTTGGAAPVQVSLETKDAEVTVSETSTPLLENCSLDKQSEDELSTSNGVEVTPPPPQLPPPFRIPAWEAAEQSYLQLAISNLNNLTRSYNLMAPDLAKKPYFSLERELKSCYADVAPLLAQEIKERAARPARAVIATVGPSSGGMLERFAGEGTAKIYDSKRPLYGFREFWNDLFGEKRA